jgi:hypothetical protein
MMFWFCIVNLFVLVEKCDLYLSFFGWKWSILVIFVRIKFLYVFKKREREREILHILYILYILSEKVTISHFCNLWSSVFFDDFSCWEILLPFFYTSFHLFIIYGYGWMYQGWCKDYMNLSTVFLRLVFVSRRNIIEYVHDTSLCTFEAPTYYP